MAESQPAGPGTGVRAARTAATRARMLAAARELFVATGYASTSMQAIARAAGVAVQTLYFTFSTKRAMLSEVVDVAVAGDAEPVATLDRPWVAEAIAAAPVRQLHLQAAAAARIYADVAPLLEVVRSAAAVDPEIAGLWRTNIAQRHTVMATLAGALAAKTRLRGERDAVQVADIMLATLSPENYRLLVHDRGWSRKAWQDWAADALVRQLLPVEN